MKGLSFPVAACAAVSLAAALRADVTNTFTTDPLGDSSVSVQGPDKLNVNSRFTYNAADHTLTAHYDSQMPTVKLLFPLNGLHLTQDTNFSMSATFKVLSAGFIIPPTYGGPAPSFGLVNSAHTGDVRSSITDMDGNEAVPGNCYDMLTVDYYPTLDQMYGGDTVNLSFYQSVQSGVSLYNSGTASGYALATLPLDQSITANVSYDSSTRKATLVWNNSSVISRPIAGNFDVDSFALTLWYDPWLSPEPYAFPWGTREAADVVFGAFSVTAAPEPGTLALLTCGILALVRRQRKCRAEARS